MLAARRLAPLPAREHRPDICNIQHRLTSRAGEAQTLNFATRVRAVEMGGASQQKSAEAKERPKKKGPE